MRFHPYPRLRSLPPVDVDSNRLLLAIPTRESRRLSSSSLSPQSPNAAFRPANDAKVSSPLAQLEPSAVSEEQLVGDKHASLVKIETTPTDIDVPAAVDDKEALGILVTLADTAASRECTPIAEPQVPTSNTQKRPPALKLVRSNIPLDTNEEKVLKAFITAKDPNQTWRHPFVRAPAMSKNHRVNPVARRDQHSEADNRQYAVVSRIGAPNQREVPRTVPGIRASSPASSLSGSTSLAAYSTPPVRPASFSAAIIADDTSRHHPTGSGQQLLAHKAIHGRLRSLDDLPRPSASLINGRHERAHIHSTPSGASTESIKPLSFSHAHLFKLSRNICAFYNCSGELKERQQNAKTNVLQCSQCTRIFWKHAEKVPLSMTICPLYGCVGRVVVAEDPVNGLLDGCNTCRSVFLQRKHETHPRSAGSTTR